MAWLWKCSRSSGVLDRGIPDGPAGHSMPVVTGALATSARRICSRRAVATRVPSSVDRVASSRRTLRPGRATSTVVARGASGGGQGGGGEAHLRAGAGPRRGGGRGGVGPGGGQRGGEAGRARGGGGLAVAARIHQAAGERGGDRPRGGRAGRPRAAGEAGGLP